MPLVLVKCGSHARISTHTSARHELSSKFSRSVKDAYLVYLLKELSDVSTIIFTASCKYVNAIPYYKNEVLRPLMRTMAFFFAVGWFLTVAIVDAYATLCCRSCELLHTMISLLDIESVALHSRLSQAQRLRALAHFKSSRARVLVATDVGSRCANGWVGHD